MTNNQLTDKRLSDSDLEDLICELEAAGFYRRQLICLVELQERRKADSEPVCFVSERNLANLTKHQVSVYVKAEPVMVRPVALYLHAQPAPVASMAKNPTEKSAFLQHAESLATDAKELAERVQRNDVKALTTSEEHRQLRDLVMMVKMLCRTIRKYNPESQQAADYTAYLQKEGLISAADCLRDSDWLDTESEDRRG